MHAVPEISSRQSGCAWAALGAPTARAALPAEVGGHDLFKGLADKPLGIVAPTYLHATRIGPQVVGEGLRVAQIPLNTPGIESIHLLV